MGGGVLKELLDGIDLSELIENLSKEAEGAKPTHEEVMKVFACLKACSVPVFAQALCVSVSAGYPSDLRPMVAACWWPLCDL